MARGEIFTAEVEQIAAGGAGLARSEGKVIFIELTAPGDKVRFSIKEEHKNWAAGELIEILEPSPLREEPVCPFYGRCGGCSLQHLNYEAQIDAKNAILRDAFKRIGSIDPPEIHIHRSGPFEYRNRVQFHKIDENSAGLCFKERKSSRLVNITDCPVTDRGIREALKESKLNPGGRKRFTVYSRLNTFLYEGGVERGKVSILGKDLTMDAGVFFQSNAVMLEQLLGDLVRAASAADKSLPMADVYCGVGTFASFLGTEFNGTDLIEENKTALDLARENVRGKKVTYYSLTDTDWVKAMKNNTTKHQTTGTEMPKNNYGFMVLDPPREGLSRPLCEWLAHNGPELAAYVSCDSATLARDARILLKGGYTLKELDLYDFYPQTAHMESLAVFCKADEVPHGK